MMKFFLILLFLFPSHAYAQDFIVIVNRDGPLVDAKMGVIKEVYLGEKRFASATRLLPVNFKEGPLKDAFLKTVVNMSPKEYKHHSIKKVFQEGFSIPLMGSPVDIVKFVRKEKGAVAYLPTTWAENIRSGNPKGIEHIKIIGP
jgi:hypothetical protein